MYTTEVGLQRRLRAASQALRLDASGNVCGTCVHFAKPRGCHSGWCRTRNNLEGGALLIFTEKAVGCPLWAQRAPQTKDIAI